MYGNNAKKYTCTQYCEVRTWVFLIFVVVNGEDYQHFSSIVTFEKEETEVRRRVRILDDQVLESTKTFSVVIEAVPETYPVAVMNSTAAVEIRDDDSECFVGYAPRSPTAIANLF